MSKITEESSKAFERSQVLSVCSDIEQYLLDMMLENNEDEMSPQNYLTQYYSEIYEAVMDGDDRKDDDDYRDMIYDSVFIHVDFDSISEAIQDANACAKDPYRYNGVKRSDFL